MGKHESWGFSRAKFHKVDKGGMVLRWSADYSPDSARAADNSLSAASANGPLNVRMLRGWKFIRNISVQWNCLVQSV